MSNSKYIQNSFSDSFFSLSDVVTQKLLLPAEISAMDRRGAADVLSDDLMGKSVFSFSRAVRNADGVIHAALLHAADIAGAILCSRPFLRSFMDCFCDAYKLEAPSEDELNSLHPAILEFVRGGFVISVDDFSGLNAYALIYREHAMRVIFMNIYIIHALETYTSAAGTPAEEQGRVRRAVAFLAMKMVHEAAHWVGTWMMADRFYDPNTEEFTNKTTPALEKFGYEFEDFGNAVEAALFNGYAALVDTPHHSIHNVRAKGAISEVTMHVFCDGKQNAYRYIPPTEPFSLASLGIGTADATVVTLGARQILPSNRYAAKNVAKKPREDAAPARVSERKRQKIDDESVHDSATRPSVSHADAELDGDANDGNNFCLRSRLHSPDVETDPWGVAALRDGRIRT